MMMGMFGIGFLRCRGCLRSNLKPYPPPPFLCRYGFGKNKRIVLYDTLLAHCSEEQVVAVLAHELGG